MEIHPGVIRHADKYLFTLLLGQFLQLKCVSIMRIRIHELHRIFPCNRTLRDEKKQREEYLRLLPMVRIVIAHELDYFHDSPRICWNKPLGDESQTEYTFSVAFGVLRGTKFVKNTDRESRRKVSCGVSLGRSGAIRIMSPRSSTGAKHTFLLFFV